VAKYLLYKIGKSFFNNDLLILISAIIADAPLSIASLIYLYLLDGDVLIDINIFYKDRLILSDNLLCIII